GLRVRRPVLWARGRIQHANGPSVNLIFAQQSVRESFCHFFQEQMVLVSLALICFEALCSLFWILLFSPGHFRLELGLFLLVLFGLRWLIIPGNQPVIRRTVDHCELVRFDPGPFYITLSIPIMRSGLPVSLRRSH